jgi:DNA primase
LLVCEGAIDALTAAGAGVSAVAVLGATYVDERVAAHIVEGAAGRSVVLALDGDRAGQVATETTAAALAMSGCGSQVLPIPAATDLNSVVRKQSDWICRAIRGVDMGWHVVTSPGARDDGRSSNIVRQ